MISLRFGTKGDGMKTLEEVGKIMQITRERVRQIEARALIKLDQAMEDVEPLRHYASMVDLLGLLQLCYVVVHRHDQLHSRIDKP